jgi:hypothetical protein
MSEKGKQHQEPETEKNKDSALVPSVKTGTLADTADGSIDEAVLFERVAAIIENRKYRAAAHANSEATLMFWEVGQYINSVVLEFKRAAYGKQILMTLSAKLIENYGKNFSERNIYRMTLFAERFPDIKILPTLSAKLSWSHIIELLPLKSTEAQLYYAQEVVTRNLGVHDLRKQISRKAYERREIANTELSEQSAVPFNVFKDPYLLDMFALKTTILKLIWKKLSLLILNPSYWSSDMAFRLWPGKSG